MARQKMNLKSSRKKRGLFKIKLLILVIMAYISFSVTYYYSLKMDIIINNESFIKLLLNQGNANILYDYKPTKIVNSTMKYLLNIDFSRPETLLSTNIFLEDDVVDNEKMEISISYEEEEYNLDELKEVSEYIADPNDVDINNPVVYIYNSHQLENYSSDNLEIYGITPNVLMASYILKEKLNEKGISTIVETTNIEEFLNVNGWKYNRSYDATRVLLTEKKNKYPSLKYFIDLHRDAVSKEMATMVINGKSYAKILFVVGLEHANWQQNMDIATRLNSYIESLYPGLSRGILKKEGANVNGIYNQDLSSNSMLIEVGTVSNTIEEVFNTVDALVEVLSKFIGDDTY